MSSYFTDLAQQYIDGEWRPGTGSWDIIDFNPYDGEKLASITIATVDEVDQAYRAAARAQKEWAATNPYARRPSSRRPCGSSRSASRRSPRRSSRSSAARI